MAQLESISEIGKAESLSFYKNVRVGRLPYTELSEDAEKIAYYRAVEVTGSEDVLVFCHVYDSEEYGPQIYYIAAPSSAGANERSTVIPFTDVLPGCEYFEGPGVYMIDIQGQTAALIINFNYEIEFLINDKESVESRYHLLGDKAVYTDISACTGKGLLNFNLHYKQYTRNILGKITVGLMALFAIEVLCVLFLVYKTAQYNNMKKSTIDIAQALEMAKQQLVTTQPISPKLADFTRVASSVNRAGGWLQEYRIYQDGKVYLRAKMPSWVYGDTLKELGSDAVPTKLLDENMIKVERGIKQ